jgi:RTX calcium-binding nonapeptide repeat (4 copies)
VSRRWAPLAAAVAALAAIAPPAMAHHSIFIREVRASATSPDAAFVELQAYRQGQNGIGGSQLLVYDQTGAAQTPFTLLTGVANAQSQRTMLIGAAGVPGADYTFAGLGTALSPLGGAVCLNEAAPPDCVSWGAFSGASMLPFPGAGAPAPAIGEGLSLTRTIARGCALGLDGEDDSDASAADFTVGPPTPRPNSAAPSERDCVPCGGSDATIIGTDGKETIRGTKGPDVIAAQAGADKIKGLGGNDVLCGGIGKDALVGGGGRDRLIGARGRDTCKGGKGRDSLKSCEAGDTG